MTNSPPPLKRFFTKAHWVKGASGYSIYLDERPLKTPERNPLVVSSIDFATALVDEWNAQIDKINPQNMPLSRLAYTALDRMQKVEKRNAFHQHLLTIANADLLCYLADEPNELVAEETKLRAPLRQKMETFLGCEFILIHGIIHQPQNHETLKVVSLWLEKLEPFVFASLYEMATLTSSLLLAGGVVEQLFSKDQAWQAAILEENRQFKKWGYDKEAADRLCERKDLFFNSANVCIWEKTKR